MKVRAAIEKLQQEIREPTVRQTFGGDAGLGERGAETSTERSRAPTGDYNLCLQMVSRGYFWRCFSAQSS